MVAHLRPVLCFIAEPAVNPVLLTVISPAGLRYCTMVFIGICVHRLNMFQEARITAAPSTVTRYTGNNHIAAGCTAIFVVCIAHITVITETETLSAICTEMMFILRIFHTHAVAAFGFFTAAKFAKSAGFADITAAVAAVSAFFTDC